MVDEGDDEKFRGLESGQKLFSKCVFRFICIWVLLAYISWKSTLIFGNSKKLQQSTEVMGSIIQKRIVVLCKTFWSSHWKKWICVVFLFLCFVKWSDGVKNIGLCDLCGLASNIYVIVCKHELQFPWCEDFEKMKEGQWVQERDQSWRAPKSLVRPKTGPSYSNSKIVKDSGHTPNL